MEFVFALVCNIALFELSRGLHIVEYKMRQHLPPLCEILAIGYVLLSGCFWQPGITALNVASISLLIYRSYSMHKLVPTAKMVAEIIRAEEIRFKTQLHQALQAAQKRSYKRTFSVNYPDKQEWIINIDQKEMTLIDIDGSQATILPINGMIAYHKSIDAKNGLATYTFYNPGYNILRTFQPMKIVRVKL